MNKKLALGLVVGSLILAVVLCMGVLVMTGNNGGGGGTDPLVAYNANCQTNWNSLASAASGVSSSEIMDYVLNRQFAPNTVGQIVKDCLNSGWRPK